VGRTPGRRLFFDLETSPNIGLFWNPGRKISLSHENIVKERAIICVCWKWEGARGVRHLTWDGDQCDKALLEEFVEVMNAAGEVVAHNGDRFDIPWIRGRCLKHGIQMEPSFFSIDTLKLTRAYFNLNSARLDYLGKYLGLGGKKPTDYELWKLVLLDRDPKALRRMVNYCKRDVVLLEKVWDRLNPYVPARSNRAEHLDECPECGSERTIVNKHRTTAAGYKKTQFQCRDCGKYMTVASSRFAKSRATREETVALKELARG
jgi:uncharacterized protein YprB with RNaseH-like and TPR domain